MPPKQAQIGGYALFCQKEVKPYYDQLEGRSLSMPEAIQRGSEWWAEMDPQDKEYWKAQAKVYKRTDEWRDQKKTYRERVLRDKERGPPSSGKVGKAKEKKRLAMEAEEEERKVHPYYDDTDVELLEKKRDRDLQDITDDIIWNEPGNTAEEKRRWICERHWHMLSVIPYFEREYDHAFAPAELVLIEFNMEDGIENVDNWLIAHGIEDFEEGLFSQALRRSEVHKINVSQSKENVGSLGLRTDYDVIYKEIVQKTKGDKFVYVYSKDYNAVQGCLDFLRVNAMDMNTRVTAVLPHSRIAFIEDLIKVLARHRNFKVDDEELARDCRPEAWASFDLNRETLCAYHYNVQCKVCAEATAKKILYYLFDKTSEQYQYVLGSGHFPDNVEVASCDDMDDLFGPIGTGNGQIQATASSSVSTNHKQPLASRPVQDYDDESDDDAGFASGVNEELSTLTINDSIRPVPAGRGRGFLSDEDDLPAPGLPIKNQKVPIKAVPFAPQEMAFPLAPPFVNAPVAQRNAMERTRPQGETRARDLDVNVPNHTTGFKHVPLQVEQRKPKTLPPSAMLKNRGMKVSPRKNDEQVPQQRVIPELANVDLQRQLLNCSTASASSTIADGRPPPLAMRGLGRGMTTGIRPKNPGGKI